MKAEKETPGKLAQVESERDALRESLDEALDALYETRSLQPKVREVLFKHGRIV